jgi:hypothetical protein
MPTGASSLRVLTINTASDLDTQGCPTSRANPVPTPRSTHDPLAGTEADLCKGTQPVIASWPPDSHQTAPTPVRLISASAESASGTWMGTIPHRNPPPVRSRKVGRRRTGSIPATRPQALRTPRMDVCSEAEMQEQARPREAGRSVRSSGGEKREVCPISRLLRNSHWKSM